MWNEEAYIEPAVAAAREVCQLLVREHEIADYEILIVDDASTDRTAAIADRLAEANPRVRVIHHPKNRKLGGSLKTGFAAARGELVLYTDADLPFDLYEIARACRLLRTHEADAVCGYRLHRDGEGLRRALYSVVWNGLIRRGFGVPQRDLNFSFKLVRRNVFDHVVLTSEGSFVDAELLIQLHRFGYRVLQIGVDYFARNRGISTLSSWSVIARMLREGLLRSGELRRIERLPESELARGRRSTVAPMVMSEQAKP
jgi:glycosyltransferase involved in cell wall biosynthesis